MKRKRIPVFLFCMILLFTLSATGCGAEPETQGTQETQGAQEAQAEKITMKVASIQPVDHRSNKSLERVKEKVEAGADGRIELKLYPVNQLGDYTQVFEEIRKGTIEAGLIFVPSQFDPTLELGSLPYLAENYEQIRKELSPGSFVCDTIETALEDLGVKQIRIFAEGFIGYGTSKMPKDPADPSVDKGILVRVAPLAVYKESAGDLGFRTTTIPYADTFSAMQTGVCDGWVGGSPQINYQVFGDVIKYYLPYNCFFDQTAFLVNLDLWNSLSAEEQQLFIDAIDIEADESFASCEAEDEKYLEEMKDKGIEIFEFTDEELEQLAVYSRNTTWPKFKDRFGEELINDLLEAYN